VGDGGSAGDGGKRLVRAGVYCGGSTRREYAGRGSVFAGGRGFRRADASLRG
jgi:hypothetical protein